MDINNLKKIISTESLSGHEEAVMKILIGIGEKSGTKCFRQDKNVVFYIGGKNPGKAVIFNGHVDTVSPGDLSKWKYPATGKSIKVDGEKIYGLGSSDMKSAVFSFTEVAKYYALNMPAVDLWFSFVIKEEVDGSGSKSFVDWFKKNHLKKYGEVSAVIGEATNLDEIDIGHKGNYFIKITTSGDSGHGAYPERIKKHAFFEMVKVTQILKKLETVWQKKYKHEKLGVPTIGMVTSISAGDIGSPNKFPDRCTASFDIRTTPGVHPGVMKELVNALSEIKCEIVNVFDPAWYSYTDPDEKIVKALLEITGKLPLKTASGASDQCFFTEAGIPSVVFGPGEKKLIHKPDEYCYLEKIKKSIEVYKKIVSAVA